MEPDDIITTFDAAGLDVPDRVHYAAAIIAAADRFVNSDLARLEEELLAEIEAGTLAPDDLPDRWTAIQVDLALAGTGAPSVNGQGRRDNRHVTVTASRSAAHRIAAEAVLEVAGAVVKQLAPRFDSAAAVVVATLEPVEQRGLRYDNSPQFESIDTPGRSGALATLHTIRDVRRLLGKAGYGPHGETAAWWSTPDTKAKLIAGNGCFVGGRDPFVALAELGLPLRLNDAADAERIAALAAKRPPLDLLTGLP